MAFHREWRVGFRLGNVEGHVEAFQQGSTCNRVDQIIDGQFIQREGEGAFIGLIHFRGIHGDRQIIQRHTAKCHRLEGRICLHLFAGNQARDKGSRCIIRLEHNDLANIEAGTFWNVSWLDIFQCHPVKGRPCLCHVQAFKHQCGCDEFQIVAFIAFDLEIHIGQRGDAALGGRAVEADSVIT